MLESSKVPALTRAIDILNLIARIGPVVLRRSLTHWGSLKAQPICCLMNSGVSVFLALITVKIFCLWTELVELSGHALSKMDPRTGSTAFDATDGYHRAVMSPGLLITAALITF